MFVLCFAYSISCCNSYRAIFWTYFLQLIIAIRFYLRIHVNAFYRLHVFISYVPFDMLFLHLFHIFKFLLFFLLFLLFAFFSFFPYAIFFFYLLISYIIFLCLGIIFCGCIFWGGIMIIFWPKSNTIRALEDPIKPSHGP